MPNGKSRRRQFGSIRRLPSGRYQARYPGPDSVLRPADDTFGTKTDAADWLTLKEAEILESEWTYLEAGDVLVPDYAATWIDERPSLRPKTILIYEGLLRKHIAPHFEHVTIAEVTLRAFGAGARSCSTPASARSPLLRRTGFSVPSSTQRSMTS